MNAKKLILKSFIVNLFLTILKLFGGILFSSITLVSDSVHSFVDIMSDSFALLGEKLSNKKADYLHPYGHGKVEYLTSMFIGAFIIATSILMFIESFKHKNLDTSIFSILIIILTFIIKFSLSKYLLKKGTEINNNIVLSIALESRNDVYAALITAIFIILSIFKSEFILIKYSDMLGSLFISIIIFISGVKVFFKNITSLIGEANLSNEKINGINRIIRNYENIKDVRRITILKYGSYNSLIIDVLLKKNIRFKKLYLIETNIKKEIKEKYNEIKYVNINFKL